MLRVCDAIEEESNIHGKSELKRIVSILPRLVQRSQSVAEDAFEYEYEYEESPENQTANVYLHYVLDLPWLEVHDQFQEDQISIEQILDTSPAKQLRTCKRV